MKGQGGFELYFSVSAFIIVVVYIFFELIKQYPSYFEKIDNERFMLEAYQVSEILVNDPGLPVDWNKLPVSEIKRLGLNSEKFNKTNLISLEKSLKLNQLCEENEEVLKRGLNLEYDLNIFLVDGNGNLIIKCETLKDIPPKAEIRRIVSIYNESSKNILYGELILEVGEVK